MFPNREKKGNCTFPLDQEAKISEFIFKFSEERGDKISKDGKI
jgi:hypothetical protein